MEIDVGNWSFGVSIHAPAGGATLQLQHASGA